MAETELAGDLFPISGSGTSPRPTMEASPVASGSRSPKPVASPPAKADSDDDDGDLFGDDDEDDDNLNERPVAESSATPGKTESQRGSAPPDGSPHPMEYAEEDVSENEQEQVWANLALPKRPKLKATDGKAWHFRLPTYLNIAPQPYDPEHYRETLKDDPIDGKSDPVGAKARMMGIKNTIRWKWVSGPDGKPVRKSNARLLRWSDGSMSLQLGSSLFDLATSHGTSLARPEDPQPSKPLQPPAKTTFLCNFYKDVKVFMTEKSVAGQISVVPTSMTSATHLELARHVGQQHVRHSRMKVLEDNVKPEEVQKMLLKAAGKDVTAKPRAKRAPGNGARRTSRGRRARSEDSDEDRAYRRERDYDEDDGFVVADDDEEEEAEETEDEDDAAWGSSKRKSKKSKKSGRKRKGSESMDELELADRRLAEKERERKRARQAKSRDYVDDSDEDEDEEVDDADEMGGEEDADMEMDVESEEE